MMVCISCLIVDLLFQKKKNSCSKGRVMGSLLALVCPCFRKNVIVTCKIVSFLCSLDTTSGVDFYMRHFGAINQ